MASDETPLHSTTQMMELVTVITHMELYRLLQDDDSSSQKVWVFDCRQRSHYDERRVKGSLSCPDLPDGVLPHLQLPAESHGKCVKACLDVLREDEQDFSSLTERLDEMLFPSEQSVRKHPYPHTIVLLDQGAQFLSARSPCWRVASLLCRALSLIMSSHPDQSTALDSVPQIRFLKGGMLVLSSRCEEMLERSPALLHALSRQEINMVRALSPVCSLNFPCDSPSIVLDGALFLGNRADAKSREIHAAFGIRSVLNCAKLIPSFHKARAEYTYLHLPLEDSEEQVQDPAFVSQVSAGVDFIVQQLAKGQSVLVHCAAGASRSATVVLCYLLRHKQMRLWEAYQFLKRARGTIAPNPAFMKWLIAEEQRLTAAAAAAAATSPENKEDQDTDKDKEQDATASAAPSAQVAGDSKEDRTTPVTSSSLFTTNTKKRVLTPPHYPPSATIAPYIVELAWSSRVLEALSEAEKLLDLQQNGP